VETPHKINLRQFVRKKQSKRFLLKFAAYFFMIGFILTLLFQKLNENERGNKLNPKIKNPREIRGLKLQLEDTINSI
jgi:hypothetical protein